MTYIIATFKTTTLLGKLLHLAHLEDSYVALMKVGSDDSMVQVGYKDEYDNLDLDDFCDYDDHYKIISQCLQKILLSLEDEDIQNQQQMQLLKEWIERYPLSLGIINWDGYDFCDEFHEASEQFPFLLREIIRKKKFRLLPFLIEAGMDYFENGLRGGLLQKLSCFDEVYGGEDFLEHDLFPNNIVYPEMTVLDAIVGFNYDDSIALDVLSTLKDMDILQRNDIQEQNLLSKTLFPVMLERFNFFVEMNPEALLEEVDEADKFAFDIVHGEDEFNFRYDDWTPALILIFATYDKTDSEAALHASLKFYPRNLGLLLLQAKDNSSYPSWKDRAVLLSYVKEWFDIYRGWEMIEESFGEMKNRHTLFSLDHQKAIYPFMSVAESLAVCCNDGDIKLTLLYYLLREDLSWSDVL